MHADWQQLITLVIVAVAAWSVGRRLWGQVAAFRSRPARRAPSKSPARPAPPRQETLMQIQLKPPVHLKRPPADNADR